MDTLQKYKRLFFKLSIYKAWCPELTIKLIIMKEKIRKLYKESIQVKLKITWK